MIPLTDEQLEILERVSCQRFHGAFFTPQKDMTALIAQAREANRLRLDMHTFLEGNEELQDAYHKAVAQLAASQARDSKCQDGKIKELDQIKSAKAEKAIDDAWEKNFK